MDFGPTYIAQTCWTWVGLAIFCHAGFPRCRSLAMGSMKAWAIVSVSECMFLCVVTVCLAQSRRRQSSISSVTLAPLLVAVGVLTLFAFSTRVTLGSTELVDFTPKHLFAIGAFRCSGRFIWPSVYLITLLAIATVARRGRRFAIPLLGIAFLAQLLDLTPMHIQDARIRTGAFAQEAEPVLHDMYWAEAVRGRHHITLVPPAACGVEAARRIFHSRYWQRTTA